MALRAERSGHEVQLENLHAQIQRLEKDNVHLHPTAIRAKVRSLPDSELIEMFGERRSSDGPATGDCACVPALGVRCEPREFQLQ